MAIGTPTVVYSGNAAPALTSTQTFTLTSAVPAGAKAVLTVATNITTNVTITLAVTDSGGNTWVTDRQPVNDSGGVTVRAAIASADVPSGLPVGATVTCTYTGDTATRWVCTILSATGLKTGGAEATGFATPASTAAMNVSTSTATTTADALVVAGFGSGVRVFTVGSGFTVAGTPATSAGSADRQLSSEYAVVASAGVQTATGTLATASTNVQVIAAYGAAAPSGTPVYLSTVAADAAVTVGAGTKRTAALTAPSGSLTQAIKVGTV